MTDHNGAPDYAKSQLDQSKLRKMMDDFHSNPRKHFDELFGNLEQPIIPIDNNTPHKVSEVICVKCGRRWLAVRPEGTLLKHLECLCGMTGFVIETGEIIEDKSYG